MTDNLTLDFLNKSYSLEEIIDGFTDGNIENFENDEDFLSFLLGVSVGIFFDKDTIEDEDFKKYANLNIYAASGYSKDELEGFILSMMLLDTYGYYGKKLYDIYKICNKDKIDFLRTCLLIGRLSIDHSFNKETVDKNLELKNPVPFIDKSIVYDVRNYDKYRYEIEWSLRHRINESIKANYENVTPLKEKPSYAEKEAEKKKKEEERKSLNDYDFKYDNLYFGSLTLDRSSIVSEMSLKLASWFEYMEFKILNYAVFRSIPGCDYFLVDENGDCHILEEVISKNGVTVGPNSQVRKVKMAKLDKIFTDSESLFDDDNLNSNISYFKEKEPVKLEDLDNYESIVRDLYEANYGSIFNDERNDFESNYRPKK